MHQSFVAGRSSVRRRHWGTPFANLEALCDLVPQLGAPSRLAQIEESMLRPLAKTQGTSDD